MSIANDLTFEYESITGAYTIQGPMLKFTVIAEYASQVNVPTLYIDIVGGRLHVYGEQGLIEVGDLTPEAVSPLYLQGESFLLYCAPSFYQSHSRDFSK